MRVQIQSKKTINIIACLLLLFMMIVAVLSMKGDSLTMDELAHIPAGYGYMHEKDYRLNPEHPPLLKDLAAIPLLFMNLNFDKEFSAWKNDVNGQWTMGWKFIFASGNNAEKIIFWARIPMILILLILGIYIFKWTKKLFGPKTALFSLFLFSFSPTFIAHGRYVTTDVGAAAAFFIATYYFVKWLEVPTKKNLIIAGIVFGIAQLIKFSLFLLVVYFGLLLLIKIYIRWRETRPCTRTSPVQGRQKLLKLIIDYGLKFALILIIGYLIIFPVYQYHVLNYPPENQVRDANFILTSYSVRPLANLVVWMADKPILRAYAQYLLGLLMVFQRASGGNTTFFLGEISATGWRHYFPIVYAIKEPLALHILTIIALLFLAWQIRLKEIRFPEGNRISQKLKKVFPELAMLIFIGIYWVLSIKSNLNIGIRHVLPTLPFVYILVSGQFKRAFDYVKNKKAISTTCYLLFAICLIWYAFSSFSIFPHYLSYFNELVGGAKNGYLYVADSNLDWGQDLKRLNNWIEKYNNCTIVKSPEACMNYTVPIQYNKPIEKIKVDYFGGSDTNYYLGNKYEPWHGDSKPEQAKGSWLAISATLLQGGRGLAAPGFISPTGYYRWLYDYKPVTVIGNSIFVYYID